MHLRIVPQRLKVAHALNGVRYSLAVAYPPVVYAHLEPKALAYQRLYHVNLHPAHELDVNFPQKLVPYYVKLRVLLLKLAQL